MSALWTAAEAAAATGGRALGDWQVTGVSIDTRTIRPGDLFVALAAARDGHEFVAQALAKGAAAAMVTHIPEGVAPDAPLLIVDEVLPALERLGIAGRARLEGKLIAITGSVGKTSTKEMLRAVLAGQGRVHAAEASYNNHWGVPLTLARMPADTEFAIIEIGMNHPGEIAPLAKMARPDVAMITTVAAAHLEAFDDIAGIAAEKSAIFEGLEEDGACIINDDMPDEALLTIEGAAWATGQRTFRFGSRDTAHIRLERVELSDDTTVAKVDIDGQKQIFRLTTAGRHFASNAAGVLAVVKALGADVTLAARDLALWAPPAGRGTREDVLLDPVDELTLTLIDDAFNANPTSMAAALEVLAAATPVDGVGRIAQGRRIAVLGDMLELGPDEIAMHQGLAELSHMDALDVVHCVGPRMKALWERLPAAQQGVWTETAGEMAEKIRHLVDAGDVLLVKGSKGSYVSRVVDAVRKMGHPLPTE